jgi:hypothetical protein
MKDTGLPPEARGNDEIVKGGFAKSQVEYAAFI